MNPLAGSAVFCAKAGDTASRALRPSAAAMAVETTKSRRDRLSMGHLLETKFGSAGDARRRGGDSPCWRFIPGRKRKRSHRLERAIELDVDQHRLAVLERLCDQIGGLVHCLGTFRRDAERTRKRDEVDPGIDKLHADVAVGLLGKATHRMQALLEDAI